MSRNFTAPTFDFERERAAFLAFMNEPSTQAELRKQLGEDAAWSAFYSAAIDVVTKPPGRSVPLLRPDLRQSLLLGLRKAARQGLRPDGKEGALIPRKNNETGEYGVEWTPMVWGVTKLARATGAIAKLNAQIVYEGEQFEIYGGSDDKIIHRILPQARAAGLERAIGAYCIFTSASGVQTSRFLLKSEIYDRRKVSSAFRNGGGPWIGPFESEMWIKTVVLHTAKWIELDITSLSAKRFMAALEDELQGDFEDADDPPEIEGRVEVETAAAITDDRLARYHLPTDGQREPVDAGRGTPPQQTRSRPSDERYPEDRDDPRGDYGASDPGGDPRDQGPGEPRQDAPQTQGTPQGHGAPQGRQDAPQGRQDTPRQDQQAVVRSPRPAGNTPAAWVDWFFANVIDPQTSWQELRVNYQNTAVNRRLAQLKSLAEPGSADDLYGPLVARVHAKMRALGAPDVELKDLINVR